MGRYVGDREEGAMRLAYCALRASFVARSAIRLCRRWQWIGVVSERVIHFAGSAAPLGEVCLHAPRAFGRVQGFKENRRIVDQDFGLKKLSVLDQAKAFDHVQLFTV